MYTFGLISNFIIIITIVMSRDSADEIQKSFVECI